MGDADVVVDDDADSKEVIRGEGTSFSESLSAATMALIVSLAAAAALLNIQR